MDALLSVVFSLGVALAGFGVSGWLVLSGRFQTLDGLLMILIGLTLGGIFLFDLAWSFRTGELREVLNSLAKGSNGPALSAPPPA